jgi:hypothetical protein
LSRHVIRFLVELLTAYSTIRPTMPVPAPVLVPKTATAEPTRDVPLETNVTDWDWKLKPVTMIPLWKNIAA